MSTPISATSNGPGVPAVRGDGLNTADGVEGFSQNVDRSGVIGVNTDGVGVKGTSTNHDGVEGFTTHKDRAAVIGVNTDGVGVKGISTSHDGVEGFTSNPNRAGVVGTNTGNGPGVLGQCDHEAGVRAISTHGTGLVAQGGTFAAQFVGNVQVTGELSLPGADYAEALTTTDPSVVPGAVVVLGMDGEVHPCDREYDRAVAGIVSGAGGIGPAIVLDRHEDSAHVALMGKVWCMADADGAPIRPGDLLTTSSTSGHCRRVTEPERALGAVVGKAITALADGRGLVQVLVSPR
ncbi:hypothetical protein ACFC1R_38270 [Kitasatospora sp. NPDC056138]|uniref:hypothetical protein n=1 Tax=Kitasatospora sp. NPDC056138 TaxID=3345724 RepID=UPI0035DED6AB